MRVRKQRATYFNCNYLCAITLALNNAATRHCDTLIRAVDRAIICCSFLRRHALPSNDISVVQPHDRFIVDAFYKILSIIISFCDLRRFKKFTATAAAKYLITHFKFGL